MVLVRRLAPVVAAAIVLSPLLRSPDSDSYPLSTYPMFSSDRGREAAIATAVGIDPDGVVSRLGPEAISGTDEVILAAATVGAAVRDDQAESLCEEIARRLSGSSYLTVVVRTEVIDVVDHLAHDAAPLEVHEHATCDVARSEDSG